MNIKCFSKRGLFNVAVAITASLYSLFAYSDFDSKNNQLILNEKYYGNLYSVYKMNALLDAYHFHFNRYKNNPDLLINQRTGVRIGSLAEMLNKRVLSSANTIEESSSASLEFGFQFGPVGITLPLEFYDKGLLSNEQVLSKEYFSVKYNTIYSQSTAEERKVLREYSIKWLNYDPEQTSEHVIKHGSEIPPQFKGRNQGEVFKESASKYSQMFG